MSCHPIPHLAIFLLLGVALATAGCQDTAHDSPERPSAAPEAAPEPSATPDDGDDDDDDDDGPTVALREVRGAPLPAHAAILSDFQSSALVKVELSAIELEHFFAKEFPGHHLETTRNGYVLSPPAGAVGEPTILASWRGDGYMLQIRRPDLDAAAPASVDTTELGGPPAGHVGKAAPSALPDEGEAPPPDGDVTLRRSATPR